MKSQLVIDRDTGNLCIQVSHGSFTATQELPPGVKTWSKQELTDYLEKIVPEMFSGLLNMRRVELRKVRDKCDS